MVTIIFQSVSLEWICAIPFRLFFFFLALSAGFYDKPFFLRCTNSSEHGEFQNRKNSSVFNFYDHSDSDLKKSKKKSDTVVLLLEQILGGIMTHH